jgi:TetR/AcrR family transcriptional repressor of nem operon
MGRPRQYDPDKALDAAQEAFWSHGYAATSMADLCAATGMKKGSLYQAFGDKRALFFAVLDRYLDAGGGWMQQLRDAPGEAVVHALADWMRSATSGACSQAGPGGCMAVNTLIELGPHDDAVQTRLGQHFAKVRAVLADAITRGQAAGTVRADRDADALAQYLQTLLTGTATAGRAGESAQALGLIDIALDAIRPRNTAATSG